MKLVADIGGTRTRLALVDTELQLHAVAIFSNDEHATFQALFAGYLAGLGLAHTLTGGCLAVAGPLADDARSITLTNRGWHIDLAALEQEFALPRLTLVNDFAAAAMGVTVSTAAPMCCLQAGKPVSTASRLVIGAGTGLGVASLLKRADGWEVMPGEGGHIGFAPQDAQQDALCLWLRARHGRVIIEHLVSGSGLSAIHHFLHGQILTPAELSQQASSGEARALASFDLFASIYGAVAGDYALARIPRGGVFLSGGVAAANLELMQRGAFVQAFNAKGQHSDVVAGMPVHIVTEPLLGLYGAALLAD